MPTYEYACTSCGQHVEVVQSFSDEPLTTCPHCGGPLRKVFGTIGIVLKGSGFYKTDSRTPSKKAGGESGEPAAASAAASKNGTAGSGGSGGSDGTAGSGSTSRSEGSGSGTTGTAGPSTSGGSGGSGGSGNEGANAVRPKSAAGSKG